MGCILDANQQCKNTLESGAEGNCCIWLYCAAHWKLAGNQKSVYLYHRTLKWA